MKVFLSYGREDIAEARRLYRDLGTAGYYVWFDAERLLGGQLWERAALEAIKDCHYFLAILSNHSVSRKGFVNREIRRALALLEEYPEDRVFIIPIRLDDCTPSYQQLSMLHRIDMFPSWDEGLRKILKTLRMGQSPEETRSETSRSGLVEWALADRITRIILDLLAGQTRPFTEDNPGQPLSSLPVSLEYDEVVEALRDQQVDLPTDSVYSVLNRLVSSGLLLVRHEGGDGQEEELRVWVALPWDLRAALHREPERRSSAGTS